MFLVIDIGNTNTVFSIYQSFKSEFQLLKSFRISSNLKRTSDEYSLIINQFFDNPNLSPKIPIPPVNRTLIKPKIEITFTFFLLKKS